MRARTSFAWGTTYGLNKEVIYMEGQYSDWLECLCRVDVLQLLGSQVLF